jgi:integrase
MPKINRPPRVRFRLYSKRGKYYIVAYFVYRPGTSFQYFTGYEATPESWDKDTQRVRPGKLKRGPDINAGLNRIEVAIIDTYGELGRTPEPEQYRNALNIKLGRADEADTPTDTDADKVPTLAEFARTFIDSKRAAKGRNTWKGYNTRINALLKFIKERRRGRASFDDINEQFLVQFREWLYAEPRAYRIGQAEAIIKKVREMMNAAAKLGYHTNSTYKGLKTIKGERTKFALTFKELERLYAFDFGPDKRLELVRDIFLVGCYTGLRFSDYNRIRPEHIKEIDGVTMLTILADKTRSHSIDITIPLLPVPLEILKKYDFAIPSLSDVLMNRYLKLVGQAAGFTDEIRVIDNKGGLPYEKTVPRWKEFKTHVARRSFATNFYREGIPIAVLMKMTGHKKESQFLEYIAIDGTENALHFAELVKNLK